jgi:hypothetical protein
VEAHTLQIKHDNCSVQWLQDRAVSAMSFRIGTSHGLALASWLERLVLTAKRLIRQSLAEWPLVKIAVGQPPNLNDRTQPCPVIGFDWAIIRLARAPPML